jgi:Putative addiction module component
MDLEALDTAALTLSPDLRARLAEKLLQSLEALSDAESERRWAQEARRRHAELASGAAAVRSAEDVFRDARARLP